MNESRPTISSYKDLLVWQKGIDIVKLVYQLTKQLPEDEKYGLVSQIRRCSVSVPSNIAEGWGRGSKGSYANFLRISRGSLLELETQLIICVELGYMSNIVDVFSLIEEESKMINALIKKIE